MDTNGVDANGDPIPDPYLFPNQNAGTTAASIWAADGPNANNFVAIGEPNRDNGQFDALYEVTYSSSGNYSQMIKQRVEAGFLANIKYIPSFNQYYVVLVTSCAYDQAIANNDATLLAPYHTDCNEFRQYLLKLDGNLNQVGSTNDVVYLGPARISDVNLDNRFEWNTTIQPVDSKILVSTLRNGGTSDIDRFQHHLIDPSTMTTLSSYTSIGRESSVVPANLTGTEFMVVDRDTDIPMVYQSDFQTVVREYQQRVDSHVFQNGNNLLRTVHRFNDSFAVEFGGPDRLQFYSSDLEEQRYIDTSVFNRQSMLRESYSLYIDEVSGKAVITFSYNSSRNDSGTPAPIGGITFENSGNAWYTVTLAFDIRDRPNTRALATSNGAEFTRAENDVRPDGNGGTIPDLESSILYYDPALLDPATLDVFDQMPDPNLTIVPISAYSIPSGMQLAFPSNYPYYYEDNGNYYIWIYTKSDSAPLTNGTEYASARKIYLVEDNTISTDAVLSEEGITLYPNPANNILHLAFSGSNSLECEIISMTGQTVMRIPSIGSDESIDIGHLKAGVYFIRALAENDELFNGTFLKR
jgi:hypothetical protein